MADTAELLNAAHEAVRARNWVAARLLDDHPDGVERGYIEYVLSFETLFSAVDLDTAERCARRTHALGEQLDDPALIALGVMSQGRVMVTRGDVAAGSALLDEAMLAAVSDDLDPSWAGNIYCHLMEACYEVLDSMVRPGTAHGGGDGINVSASFRRTA